MIEKIISGGQTGADQAAPKELDWVVLTIWINGGTLKTTFVLSLFKLLNGTVKLIV